MNRNAFGPWGVGLDAVTFAKALAAVGARSARPAFFRFKIQAEDIANEIRLSTISHNPVLWKVQPSELRVSHLSPDDLAQAWDLFREKAEVPVGIEIAEVDKDLEASWLLHELSRPEVADTVFFQAPQDFLSVPLEWPLALTFFRMLPRAS